MRNEHGLTPQQEAFAQNVAAGKTARSAYLEAYPRAKSWKDESVRVNASQLLADTNIEQRIRGLQAAAAERVILKLEDLLEETRRIAMSTPAGIIDLSNADKPRVKLPHELDAATAAAVSSFEIDDLGRIKYKFWDKNSSLERMAKILGAFEKDNRQKSPIAELLAQLSGRVAEPGVAIGPADEGDEAHRA